MSQSVKKSEGMRCERFSTGIFRNERGRIRISGLSRHGQLLGIVALLIFSFFLPKTIFSAERAKARQVLLLSIDGLKPEYVLNAEEFGLKIPNLREMVATGAYATGVKGVLPASTFPGHITLITGVSPAKHGICHNRPFDPAARVSGERWDWLAEHIQVPTLWNVASEAGRTTAGVGWPVSVGADDIHFNIPERVIGSKSAEVWSVVTPGLVDEVGEAARARIDGGEIEIANADWQRTSYAIAIIEAKQPDLIAVHLAAADTMQHRHGPFSKEAFAALEEIDMMIGKLTDAFRAVHPEGIVCAASDHGFSKVDRVLRIDAAFERAGLITFETRGKTYADSEVGEWIAKRLSAGGSSPVFLKNPEDEKAREQVRKFLNELASDPAYGIAGILEPKEIEELGGNPEADFWIDLVPGFNASHHLDGTLVATRKPNGTHGYSPTHEEMNSAFFISGKGIPAGLKLGIIDMRNIAPTLAEALGVELNSADLPGLQIFTVDQN